MEVYAYTYSINAALEKWPDLMKYLHIISEKNLLILVECTIFQLTVFIQNMPCGDDTRAVTFKGSPPPTSPLLIFPLPAPSCLLCLPCHLSVSVWMNAIVEYSIISRPSDEFYTMCALFSNCSVFVSCLPKREKTFQIEIISSVTSLNKCLR